MSIPHGFHAHVYFDQATADQAMALRQSIAKDLPRVAIGRWWDRPIGPHPMPSYQLDFSPRQEARVIDYLKANANGLSILLHTQTDDELHDHTEGTNWIGQPHSLKLEIFTHHAA